jgi:hypothetical protein
MRFVFALVLLGVLGITPAAFADSVGCGGDDTTVNPNADMTVPNDLATPRDLSLPRDLSSRGDARREVHRRRRARGAGLIVISGLGACGVAVARRRVRA